MSEGKQVMVNFLCNAFLLLFLSDASIITYALIAFFIWKGCVR